jgi:chemosensory pili system protein ChpC
MVKDENQLKCVILTLSKENVIVPNALVAEIISVKDIEQDSSMPDWYMGNMSWRGAEVPLISFEAAGGLDASKVNLNTQAAVLYAVGKDEKVSEHPYLGLIMSGVPHVSQFSREHIKTDEEAQFDHPMIAQKVRINGASISILDVDAMAEMVSKAAA